MKSKNEFSEEILEFLNLISIKVNHNPKFMNALKYEISLILINKGYVIIDDCVLVGKYIDDSNIVKRVVKKSKNKRILIARLGKENEEPNFTIEKPEATDNWNDPSLEKYGKKVKNSQIEKHSYTNNGSRNSEYRVKTTNRHSAYMSPKFTHIKKTEIEETTEFDKNNLEISFSKSEACDKGHTNYKGDFTNSSDKLKQNETTLIRRIGIYNIIKCSKYTGSKEINRYFVLENESCYLDKIFILKSDWQEITSEVYENLIKEENINESLKEKAFGIN
jgi:hypothetical protein